MVAGRNASALVLVTALCVSSGNVFAGEDSLAKARSAITAVRYDDAQALLLEALRAGGHSPDEVVEIYRLSASTAVVLGQTDVAEQYYRRWLALVPTATLPDSLAPKMRQPFVSAQAYMAAHGGLSVKTVRRDAIIEVVVDNDVLGMVASITLGEGSPRRVGADRRVRFDHADGDDVPDVYVLDELGNRLLVIDGATIPRGEPTSSSESSDDSSVPLYRRPILWGGIAVGFAITGTAFGLLARSAQSDVETIAANPRDHFADELDDARDRRDRNALVANLSFAGAAAFAVTAAVVWATRPSSSTVAVVPSAQGATVVMSRSF